MQTLVVGGRFGVWCCVLLDWLLLAGVAARSGLWRAMGIHKFVGFGAF